jgi:hypothetical protein
VGEVVTSNGDDEDSEVRVTEEWALKNLRKILAIMKISSR